MQLLNDRYCLRIATPADTAKIITLFALAFSHKLKAFHIDSNNPNQQRQLEAIWNEQACQKNNQQFVVTEGENIVATFCLSIKEPRFNTS